MGEMKALKEKMMEKMKGLQSTPAKPDANADSVPPAKDAHQH
jgi:hypothetical protein